MASITNPCLPIRQDKSQIKNSLGFTLLEVVVAVGIFGLIAIGIIALVSNLIGGGNQQAILLSDADQARKVSLQIMRELRNAAASATGAYALDTASAQQLIFYTNADSLPDIERVRYFAQNGRLNKGVVKPGGNPPAYNLAAENVQAVQNDLANGATPLFYYYDGTYNGVTDNFLSQPLNATAVKFVKLNLKIYNKGGRANTNTYTITASGAIRNLKTNLGN